MERTLNKLNRRVLAYLLSTALTLSIVPGVFSEAREPQSTPAPTSSSYTGQGAPQTEQELDSLVAPIALYPDALVAQILTGATFPDQIAVANYWLQQNTNLTGSALMQAVDKQPWDPSVKALTEFPSVLKQHGAEPGVDFAIGRGVSQPASGGDVRHSEAPRASQGRRQP